MNDDQSIAFLCPNGHKLTGPASLQGRPGQCPHCQSKFVIPDYSEFSAEAEMESLEYVSGIASSDAELVGLPGIDDLESIATEDTAIASIPHPGFLAEAPFGAANESIHLLFEQLWARRRDGSHLEVQLTNGDVLRPEFYSAAVSGPNQGFFAVRDTDGSYALASVAWSSVAQVVLRGVVHLPGDLFGG